MDRPYIICHMTTSIDGKVTGDFLSAPESAAATEHYYHINRDFKADGFGCGRVTMEESFTGGFIPELSPFESEKPWRGDYIADPTATYFAVSFDRRGRLGWKAGRISDEDPGYDNSHIIEVMCNDASDSYLAYLRSIGVSYIFAGEQEMDISLAVKKLRQFFGIKTLLLEGGSTINGAFQRAGLIDELSLVVAPVIADKNGKPLFEDAKIQDFSLMSAQPLDGGAVWLRYKKER